MASTEAQHTTIKTAKTETRTDDTPPPTWRPTVNARTVVIQRHTTGGGGSGGSSSASSSRERSTSYGANIPAGAYALISSTGVGQVKTSREQEKKEMQDLNERFASYIEKVVTHTHTTLRPKLNLAKPN